MAWAMESAGWVAKRATKAAKQRGRRCEVMGWHMDNVKIAR
jgi:hypothetical protein